MKTQLLTISIIALLSVGQTAMANSTNSLFPLSEDSPTLTLGNTDKMPHTTFTAGLSTNLYPSDEDATHRLNTSYQSFDGVGSIKASMMKEAHGHGGSTNVDIFSVDYASPE